ncbi:anthranilate N-benzoyltransferase protein 2-like [Chenopodium quinoa]|uniref:anthranilate N-benzoyltransferase protein 2-like n=1 Tax=Chenopodium quinoa TaxID=63459 RepID=UPI000B77C3D2|nr:anthranilate N-benzoyltransferase protein 2-like [Chenopodium quinoa]
MSSIKVKKSTMVCPAKVTPKGSLWLSKIDMIIRTPYSHTNVLLFYPPNNNKPFDPNIFKEALSKALVPFYPMAGRLKFNHENGRYEIDCNAKGALFIDCNATRLKLSFGTSSMSHPYQQPSVPFISQQVNTLKLQVKSQQEVTNYKLSTFEVQAGHVWRSVCMARGLANDQDVKLYIVVNGRSRMKEMGLPKGYCGNIHLYATCLEKAGDIKCKPLRYTACKIHEGHKPLRVKNERNGTTKKFDDIEYIKSAIDYLNHVLIFAINSWASLPLYEGDFGWGGPTFTRINAIKYEGKSYITPSSNRDGSFSVTLKLFSTHKEAFKEYFYNIISSKY